MSRLFLTLPLILALTACSSSKKTPEATDNELGAAGSEERPQDEGDPAGDDDSAGPGDDDSAGPGDDDSAGPGGDSEPPAGAETAADPATSAQPEKGGAEGGDQSQGLPPPGVVPAEYVPPPPGQQGILEKAATLMTGTRFRWVQGSKDVAYGLYGAPVMLNLWSCTDKNIDATLEWLKGMEKIYSDQMLSILVPANVAERSLTGQDNICGRSIRFGRSLGVDVGKGVMHELNVKELPTTLVFDSGGNVVAKHEGPLAAKSDAAKKLEGALQREMAAVIEGRSLAP
jgi:hypothetical protein